MQPPSLPAAKAVPAHAQPPVAVAADQVVAWRDGGLVAIRSGSALPGLCAKCGGGAVPPELSRRLRWHPSWVYALLLGGLLPYAIGAAVLTKSATLRYHLCARHWRVRRWGTVAAIALAVLGAVTMLGGCDRQSMTLAVLGLTWIVGAGVAAAMTGSGPLSVKRIEGEVAWVSGLHAALVGPLPDAPPAGVVAAPAFPAELQGKPVFFTGRFWTTRNFLLLAGGGVAAATALIVVAVAMSAHRRVVLDNASDVPLDVAIDGVHVLVPPRSAVTRDFEALSVHDLEVRTMQGESIAEDRLAIPDPGALERFEAVYDLTGQAVYALVTVEYCEAIEQCADPRFEPFNPTQRYFRMPAVLGGLDGAFPRTVQMDRYQRKASRTHLCHVWADDSVGCAIPQ